MPPEVDEKTNIEDSRIRLLQVGHEHMDQYAKEETADVICFNFGYLPGGDHAVATKAVTSIEAIEKGLKNPKAWRPHESLYLQWRRYRV